MAQIAAVRWLVAKDPHYSALKRAVRAAVVIPVNFAIGSELIGDPQVAVLAAFGSFALLLFVDFHGSRSSRAAAYGTVAVAGAVFITLGTLLSTPDWLAVTSMAVIGFLVLFAGVVSSIIAAAGRAVLLTFILPVMLAGHASDIPARLLGWLIACAVAIPAVLFVWPPEDQNRLRSRTAAMCHALAHALTLDPKHAGGQDYRVTTQLAVNELRAAFRASAVRPVALSTGSRLLMRLVDELEWLTTTVVNACAEGPDEWPEHARELRTAATDVLHSCADVLEHDDDGPETERHVRLAGQIQRLVKARDGVSAETLAELQAAANKPVDGTAPGEFERPLYAAHELGYLVDRTARTVRLISKADSRPWLARLLGRPPAGDVLGEAAAAERIAAGHLNQHSVALQNSIRGAAGLAVAVLIARLSNQQEGFWIVLGALSVLRSNALTTGATALRAIVGTAVGFAIGGLLVAWVGTDLTVLWTLLPIAILIAAYTPEWISFAAGQAAFTVVVIILFNIIAPTGWRIGVLRIEDVAIGCLASVVAGALFWPRGAGSALGAALSDAYAGGAAHVRAAVDYVTGRAATPPDVHGSAMASSLRLDAAFRQYLAERGAKMVSMESVTALANGASRLRLAGDAITQLKVVNPDGPAAELGEPVSLLVDQTDRIADWYSTLGGVLGGTGSNLPAVDATTANASFLDVVLPAIDDCGDSARAEVAERLLWSGQYVGDVNRLRGDLVGPAGQVQEVRSRSRWLR
ncbi:MAG TPA: FUSC family protein [Micromonosporaceae bacterium]